MKRFALLSLTFLAIGALAACARETPPAADTSAPIDVKVARAAIVEMPRAFEAGGTVRAKTTATIVSRIVAEVREIRVAPGDRVREGQPLIVLDSRELAANRLRAEATVGAAVETGRAAAAGLEAAEAGLALASATYRRIADLGQKNSATPSELDDATAGLRAAEAQVNTAKARVAEARGALAAARAAADATGIGRSYCSHRASAVL
jgi:multidrug efflux pump subunit AcrA (membrane-fusion protein)